MEKISRSLTVLNLQETAEEFELIQEALNSADAGRVSFYSYSSILEAVKRKDLLVLLVKDRNGICLVAPFQGDLFVHLLYIRKGEHLLEEVAQELIDIAAKFNFNGVRFRTERFKGMERVLKKLSFEPHAVEFLHKIGG